VYTNSNQYISINR